MLTKLDIAAIRAADALCVHLSSDYTAVRLIKRKRVSANTPFSQDIEHGLPATVELHGYRGRDEIASGQAKCFAMVNIYHNQNHAASCILKTLRVGDEIAFEFYPDGRSNGYVAAAGLHADVLYLRVRRAGKTVACWEIDSSVCAENSARMCRGVPSSESYHNSAEERRRLA